MGNGKMNRTRRSIALFVTVFAVLALVLAACGGDDDDEATDTPEATSGATEAVTGDAAAGEEVYNTLCATCHTVDGSDLVGPTWLGLWGSEVTLEDGTTVTVDKAYVVESIRDPGAKIAEGFDNLMQPFTEDQVSDEDIDNIIAYMQTLQ
jgi:mono/diheme cytochrome c family protein